MKPMLAARTRLVTLALALGSSLATTFAVAQTAPTAEQLQLFQNLSPEQQRVILDQLGAQQGGTTDIQPDVRIPRDPAAERARSGEAPIDDALKADDLVVVEFALPGTMQRGAVRLGNQLDPSADTAPRRIRTEAVLEERTRRQLTGIITRVQERNPYRLDRGGNLNLPGFPPILLAGLSEQEAVQRLSYEPSLLQLDISFQRLPVVKVGAESLKPFGYDLFESQRLGTVNGVPVSGDYIVGAGDEFIIQLFGSQNRTHRLTVNREGLISFPELGPIRLGGLRIAEARVAIQNAVANGMIGVEVSVSMGGMRSIDIVVLGEVREFGVHTVSGQATITSALFAAGGITSIGSLRDVQLSRQGRIVQHLDLYDLLILGSTANDSRLQPGDVVFVPPIGDTISIEGEVRRPAIYELRGETTAEELLRIAGGLTPQADPTRSSIVRVNERFQRVVLDIDFRSGRDGSMPLRNGDAVKVAQLRPQIDSGVMLDGFVYRPGAVAWRPGLRLTEVIGSIDELKPNADARYILIRRESAADRRISVLSADLIAALALPGGPDDLALQPRDRISVFDLAPGREIIIKPLLDELRLQSGVARPTEIVRIEGRVKAPGEYPLEREMRISDLLRAGGNLDAAAYGGHAELARYEVDETGTRQTALLQVDLASILRGDAAADIDLQPFDYLLIKETPEWAEQESVTLRGEVRFPGTYPIRRGETLFELLQRAGGLTSRAFAQGSTFTRDYLRENEREQKERLTERLRSDLATLSLQAAAADQAGAAQALASSQALLAQLQASTPVGRMVIDLPRLLAAGKDSQADISLRNGDLLVVPQARQEVTVIGEVQNSTSHLFSSDLSREDYIALSGGVTRKADNRRIYIVRADGGVVAGGGGLLRRGYSVAIQPGDTIVVPLNTERLPKLPFWQAVTQVIYNLAVSVAAINSF